MVMRQIQGVGETVLILLFQKLKHAFMYQLLTMGWKVHPGSCVARVYTHIGSQSPDNDSHHHCMLLLMSRKR